MKSEELQALHDIHTRLGQMQTSIVDVLQAQDDSLKKAAELQPQFKELNEAVEQIRGEVTSIERGFNTPSLDTRMHFENQEKIGHRLLDRIDVFFDTFAAWQDRYNNLEYFKIALLFGILVAVVFS